MHEVILLCRRVLCQAGSDINAVMAAETEYASALHNHASARPPDNYLLHKTKQQQRPLTLTRCNDDPLPSVDVRDVAPQPLFIGAQAA